MRLFKFVPFLVTQGVPPALMFVLTARPRPKYLAGSVIADLIARLIYSPCASELPTHAADPPTSPLRLNALGLLRRHAACHSGAVPLILAASRTEVLPSEGPQLLCGRMTASACNVTVILPASQVPATALRGVRCLAYPEEFFNDALE